MHTMQNSTKYCLCLSAALMSKHLFQLREVQGPVQQQQLYYGNHPDYNCCSCSQRMDNSNCNHPYYSYCYHSAGIEAVLLLLCSKSTAVTCFLLLTCGSSKAICLFASTNLRLEPVHSESLCIWMRTTLTVITTIMYQCCKPGCHHGIDQQVYCA